MIDALYLILLNRTDYELQEEYVLLLARLMVVADISHSNELDHSVIVCTQPIKHRKTQKFLDNTEYNDRPHLVVSYLSIGHEVVSRWSHRIESDRLTSMAAKLWAGRDRIKLDWQYGPYCRLLDVLLRKGALETLCNGEEFMEICIVFCSLPVLFRSSIITHDIVIEKIPDDN
ncbi:hypothetical protein KIN20_002221 [Parelaphostrongylus tenuis]|uniref:Uncharacterized protein n=1 Tax=Parelaphostrongylus tenuis TaxID=148309 RepID=A0AAD5LY55_PARTN|nr:hypothetical protein KIN20_002221 [Parelaphostrongylus tenuis]